jgi:hypothetical protein
MGNRLIVRALLVIVALLCLPNLAQAQCSGQPGNNQVCASSLTGGLPGWRPLVGADLPTPLSAPIIVNSTVITGGTSGLIPYNNAGKYGEFTMGGDCTFAAPNITCTKTGGAAFALSATTDTTNAGNIASGTLANARLNLITAAQYRQGATNPVGADQAFAAGAETTTTYGATTTFDFSTFINTAVTLTGNITTVTFSNVKAGQAGLIRFIQDGTGSRTIPATVNSTLKCSGGCNYVLSTTANAVDVLGYQCLSTTYCIGGGMLKDVK